MKFEQLYSSSEGNLYEVTARSGQRLLIECGVVWARLQEAIRYDLSNIMGCLVSHEHKDHSKAIFEVLEAGIPIYATSGTLDAYGIEPSERNVNVVSTMELAEIGPFRVVAFPINHDAAEPVGFWVREVAGENLLYATDTSHIRLRFKIPFDIIAIECSYDHERLSKQVESGEVHVAVAKRLLTSHMECHETLRYLDEFCDLSRCREIHLIHMSGERVDREALKAECEKRFFIATRIVDAHVSSC